MELDKFKQDVSARGSRVSFTSQMRNTQAQIKAFGSSPSRKSINQSFTPLSSNKIRMGIETFRDLSKDEISEVVLAVLMKQGKLRSSNDIAILSKCLLSVKFFEERKEEYGQYTIDECCKNLFLEKVEKSKTVFSIGSEYDSC